MKEKNSLKASSKEAKPKAKKKSMAKKLKKKPLGLKEFYEGGIEESQKELLRKKWTAPPPEAVAPENLILLREIRYDGREYLLEAYWSGKGYAMRVPETKRYYFLRNPEKEIPPFFESSWTIPHPSMLRRFLTMGFARKKVWIPTLEYKEGNLNPIDFFDLSEEEKEWVEHNEEAKKAIEKRKAYFFDFRHTQPDIASGVEIEMTTDVARTGAFLTVAAQSKHQTAISIGIIFMIIIAAILIFVLIGGVL